MAGTLTIRLREQDREILETAAKTQGTGLSGFIRQLAEAEAKRLRNEEIRREFEEVVKYIATHPEARDELEMYSDAVIDDWPS
ncbi:MAG TPA: DUF1778 domain-containing protein [Chloroflexota bacterium]|nr:DUF1778 domain-containing protein [Chloroflexota bacterium]